MINLFKRKQNNEVIITSFAEKAILKGKTTNEIIEEIHETFYTEVDRLLAEAKILKSTETTKQGLIDKCERLKKLGFTNTKEVKEAEAEIARISRLEADNNYNKSIQKAIEYFSVKYPLYKFITEESVKKICAKYNLVYSTIDRYTGTVPDKNLKQMESFKIANEDACYERINYGMIVHRGWAPKGTIVDYNEYKKANFIDIVNNQDPFEEFGLVMTYRRMTLEDEKVNKCSLEIAAPLKDFNIEKSELNDFQLSTKIEIPDPVVLQPIYFGGKKHYLVITAWGLEANDELVVNQKMN